MKGRDLFVLLLLAAVAGGALFQLSKRARAAWSESAGGGGKAIEFPVNDVARVTIKTSAAELTLLKKNGAWVVHERADFPASFDEVTAFVRRLWEARVGQEVKVGPSQMARLELVEPGHGDKTGTLIEVGNADGKTLAALILGKQYGSKPNDVRPDLFTTAKGRYVKTLAGARVSLVTEAFDDAVPAPQRWLLKDFVHVAAPKSITLRWPGETESWTLTREDANADWKLADAQPGEQVDNSRIFRLRQFFSTPTFVDVLSPDAPLVAGGLEQPTVAKVETFDGFHYELKIGKETEANFPVLVSVSANLPKARIAGKDETPEKKAKLDEEFQAQQKKLAEKLAKEQKLALRAVLVPRVFLADVLQKRSAILADKPAEPATAPAPTEPPTTPAPPAAATPPATPAPVAPAPATPAPAPAPQPK
jgi:hypothetical protein